LDPVRLRPQLAIVLGENGIDGEKPHRGRRRRRKRSIRRGAQDVLGLQFGGGLFDARFRQRTARSGGG
jgi:hypothetical protein